MKLIVLYHHMYAMLRFPKLTKLILDKWSKPQGPQTGLTETFILHMGVFRVGQLTNKSLLVGLRVATCATVVCVSLCSLQRAKERWKLSTCEPPMQQLANNCSKMDGREIGVEQFQHQHRSFHFFSRVLCQAWSGRFCEPTGHTFKQRK